MNDLLLCCDIMYLMICQTVYNYNMTLSKRNYFANNNAKNNSFIHSIY